MSEFVLKRDEPTTFELTVTSTAGAAVDLTDAEITFVVYGLDGSIVLTLLSEAAGAIDDADIEIPDQVADSGSEAGIFRVTVTADLEAAARWANCWVVTAADPPETFQVVKHSPFYVTGEAKP